MFRFRLLPNLAQQAVLRGHCGHARTFFNPHNPAGRPSWRKAGRVWVPKAEWVRFRWSRAVPPGVKSYRVTMDRAGRVTARGGFRDAGPVNREPHLLASLAGRR